MASRKPIVNNGGQWQNLQAGDTLAVTGIAGGDVVSQTNDESGSIVICCPVYNDANDGVKKAKADASGTAYMIGLVLDTTIAASSAGMIQVNGVFTATTAQWDAVFGTTGGLTKGTRYYVSAATAGIATATAPSTAGQYVIYIGLALSTTELILSGDFSPFLL